MLLVKHSISLENNLTISSKVEDLLLSEMDCKETSTCVQVDITRMGSILFELSK